MSTIIKPDQNQQDELIEAILLLKDKDEARDFFRDLCSINEISVISQRFSVAKLLREDRTYQEIAKETGASTATISRVSRALNFGTTGYDIILERLNNAKPK